MFNNPGLEVDLGLGIWPFAEVFDYDGDGKMDVFVRAGCVPFKDARVYINRSPGKSPAMFAAGFSVPDNTGRQRTVTGGHPATDGLKSPHPNKPHTMRWNFVDLDGDGIEDVVLSLSDWTNYGCPGPKCPIAYDANCVWTNRPIETYLYYFHNEGGNGKNAKWAKPVAIRTPNCKTDALEGPWGGYAVMFDDWDCDGDMDFICGEFVDNFWYFENVGGKGNPRFADGRKVLVEDGSPLTVELCFYVPKAVDFNGDGLKDLIAAEEDGRVSYYENTGRLKNGIPVFRFGRFLRQEAQELKFGCMCTPFGVDWDGDGDYDFICGNTSGCISFIENLSGPGETAPKWAEPKYLTAGGRRIRTIAGPSGSPQGPCEAKWGYSSVSVGDWDGDGLLDVLANDINGDVLLYSGISRGGTEMKPGKGVEVEWDGGVQPLQWWDWRPNPGKRLRAPWRTTAEMIDWNGDGLQDMVVMDTEGILVLYERFRDSGGILRLKHPQRIFIDEKGNPIRFGGEKAASGRARFRLADWDGDGRVDILNANWNVHFWRQVGEKDGKAVFRNMKKIGKEQLQGHPCSPTTVDFDNDGWPDVVVGAEDGYFYYLRNPNSGKKHLAAPAVASAKTEVMVFFDAEDFTSDRANDTIRDLANLCRDEGVRAQFAIVGYLAHEIMRYGRKDVIASLKPHVIGTQSLYHSIHPNILEKSDREDHELAYWDVYADELLGNKWIEEMSGAKPMCAVPPGNSKSYIAMYAYADLGIPYYCDTVVSDGKDGEISYCNIWQMPYYTDFTLERMLPDGSDGEPDYGKVLDRMAARGRVILYMHPNKAVFTKFWDSLNYKNGDYTPFGKWKISPERPAAETAEFYARLRRFFRRLKADPRFELTNLDRVRAAEVPRKAITRDEIPGLLAAMKNGLQCTRKPSRSVADIFQAAVRFLRGERTAEPGRVYGFLSRPVGVSSPVEVSAADLRLAAEGIDLSTFLPPSIAVGDVRIGPADFLIAALEVLSTGAMKVTVTPREQLGDLDGFVRLRDFRPRGGWILSPDFKDNYVSDRLRWQFWTLRYND